MNYKERQLLISWVRQEYDFLEELKQRIDLHKKILLELDINNLRLHKPKLNKLD